jgi:hypothetical protein
MELFDRNALNLQGGSDPAPTTAPVPFVMNSSSSQLLDLLHALRMGHFFFSFFPSLTSRLPIKKTYLAAQAFKTPATYLTLHLLTSTPPKTLNLVITQTLFAIVVCRRRGALL